MHSFDILSGSKAEPDPLLLQQLDARLGPFLEEAVAILARQIDFNALRR